MEVKLACTMPSYEKCKQTAGHRRRRQRPKASEPQCWLLIFAPPRVLFHAKQHNGTRDLWTRICNWNNRPAASNSPCSSELITCKLNAQHYCVASRRLTVALPSNSFQVLPLGLQRRRRRQKNDCYCHCWLGKRKTSSKNNYWCGNVTNTLDGSIVMIHL